MFKVDDLAIVVAKDSAYFGNVVRIVQRWKDDRSVEVNAGKFIYLTFLNEELRLLDAQPGDFVTDRSGVLIGRVDEIRATPGQQAAVLVNSEECIWWCLLRDVCIVKQPGTPELKHKTEVGGRLEFASTPHLNEDFYKECPRPEFRIGRKASLPYVSRAQALAVWKQLAVEELEESWGICAQGPTPEENADFVFRATLYTGHCSLCGLRSCMHSRLHRKFGDNV